MSAGWLAGALACFMWFDNWQIFSDANAGTFIYFLCAAIVLGFSAMPCLLAVDPATLEEPSEVVNLLAAHPSLMQRPVAILGDRAVVARPSERILELLDD